MAGKKGSGSADMQYSHTSNSQALSGKIVCPGRVVSNVIAADERGSSSLRSSGASNPHRPGSAISYRKHAAGTTPGSTKLKCSSASPSLSSSNTSFALKGPRASLAPVLKNTVNCLSGSSDESDLDIEVAEHMVSNVLESTDTAGWNSIASSSCGDFSSLSKSTMEEGVGSSRQARRHGARVLNWGECDMPHPGRARVATSSRFAFNRDGLPGLSTLQVSHNHSANGASIDSAPTNAASTPLNLDSKGRLLAEHVELSSMRGSHTLAGGSSAVNHSRQLAGSLENKRKTGTQAFQNARSGLLNSQGAGYRESNMAATSLVHGSGSRRRSASNFGFSVSDILPSASSTSAAGPTDGLRFKNSMGSCGLINGGEVFRDTRSGNNQVASGKNAGIVSICDSVGGFSLDATRSQDLNHRLEPELARPPYQTDTRCPRREACVESDRMVQCAALGFPGIQSSSSSHRRRGNSPIGFRGRNNLVSLSRPGDLFLDPIAGEFSNGSSGSNTRMWSSSGHQFAGSTGPDSGVSSRNRVKPPLSNSNGNVEEGPVSRFSFSGPPPTRPPPLPPFGSVSNITENALSVPSVMHTPGFASLPDPDHDRPNLLSGGSASYSPQSSQLYSLGENRPHLTVEGLSEVLSALERIERDEDLTYEQILMLEATILLGGIGLHDRHRDMRLDVDNMSYEELLALEEQIGDVNMGLSEETIAKCLKRQKYASPATTINYIPDDIEIKCSICQEEFEEAVELGMLECGHSHHVACIRQWLLQKNQCPVCKASACL